MNEPTNQDGSTILISADSHVAEPLDLWETRLPEAFRDRALRFPNRKLGEVHHTRAGGWDPEERLNDMAFDGVAAEVLYPSLGLGAFRTQSPILAEQYARVYNDWLMEFCAVAPDRLWGQAAIPLWNIDWAVTELERCRKGGLVGATIWFIPPDELPLYANHYEPFWAAAQDLHMPVSMHINAGPPTAAGVPNEGAPAGIQGRAAEAAAGQKQPDRERAPQPTAAPSRPHRNLVSAMNALTDIIGSGVLERYPGLHVVVAEVGVGWLPYWLEEEFDRRHLERSSHRLALLPSEYFYRQGHSTFLDDAVGGRLLSWWGADSFMWSNDYPHEKCLWPDSQATVRRILADLPEEARRKVQRSNAARLYGMPVPAPLPLPAQPLAGTLPSRRGEQLWRKRLGARAEASV